LLDSEDSSGIEGFGFDDKSDNAEAREAAGEEESREQSPSLTESVVAKHPKGTRLTTRKHRASSQPGDSKLVILFLQSTTFLGFIESLFSSCFAFLSPADKVPRTLASGDDAGVGSTVPSTPVDPLKGTKTIPPQKTAPAGSFKGGGAGAGGSRALVIGPLPKLSVPGNLSMKRAPA